MKISKQLFIIHLFLFLIPTLLFAEDPDKDPFYTEGDMLPLSKITESVDPFSGYLTIVQRDIHLPGNGGLDLDIVRTYNSAIWGRRDTLDPGLITRNEKSPLGYGWSLHMGIVKNPWGSGSSNRFVLDNPVVVMPDGSSHTLFVDKNNSSQFITKDYWIYKAITTSKWELKLTDGTKYIFEKNANAGYFTGSGVAVAQVTSIEHPNGVSKITINYDIRNAHSYIDSILDSTGRWTYFYYDDSNDRLTRINAAGINYYYYYQTEGLIPSLDFVLTEVDPPVGNRWKYTYDTTHELNKITYPFGGTINYTYSDLWFDTGATDVKFRVVTQRTTGGRDIPAGTWTYSYNSGGSSGDVTTINGPNSYQEVYTHYGWGNSGIGNVWRIGLLNTKKFYKGGSLLQTDDYAWSKSASISYDDIANADWTGTGGWVYDDYVYVPLLTSENITRDGRTYTTNYSSYDSYGNPGNISESGNLSRNTSISYWTNTSKNIVKNRPSSETVTGGFSGSFSISRSYNSNGDITQLNKYGVITNYSYFSNGNLSSKTNARGYPTSYEWAYGVIDRIVTPGYTVNRSINSNSTIASETNGRGKTTIFSYDGNLRLTAINPPAGNTTTYSYPSDSSYRKETRGSFYTYFYYDGFGRPTGTSDIKGVDTDIVYKAYGIKNYSDSEIGDKIYYDDFERVRQAVHKDGTDIDYSRSGSNVTMVNETGGSTTYTYKAFGNPDEKYLTDVNDPAGSTTSYGRNMLGSLTSITQGSITRSFTYNSKNFLTGENHPETGSISYTRDAVGNMTKKTDPSLIINYTFDGNNRLTKISSGGSCTGSCSPITVNMGYDGANNRTSMSGRGATMSYAYDSANRLTRKTETISGTIYYTDYSYDGNDNITSINYPTGRNVSYSYNSNNEMTSVSGFGGSATSFSYNLAGLPTSFSYGNGKSTSINYNSRYFPTRVTSSGAIDLAYTHDSRGNTKTQTNYRDRSKDQSYSYDSRDRLTSFSGAWGSGSFSYTSSGNRTAKNVGTESTSYQYSSNRLSSASGAEQASYSYYGNGNMSQIIESGITYSLYHDKLGSLDEFATGGSPLAEFRYDGDGMRVKKIAPDRTTIYHYDQTGNVISETDDNGTHIADYIYANNKLVAKVANDEFIIPDVPGNLSATALSSSQIDLAWTDSSDNETGFNIERKTGAGGTYALITSVGASVTTYSDNGLTPDTTYYYRVSAYNAGGESDFSNEANDTTATVPPSAPSGLSATTVSHSQIDLAWSDNSDNETGFYIERKTGAGGTYAQIAGVDANNTSYNDTGLTPDTTYFYRVKAYNLAGESAYSNEASDTTIPSTSPPATPSGLSAIAVSSVQIDLAWTDNATDEAGFKVERKTGAGGSYAQIGTAGVNVKSYSDTGLTASTSYYYRVRAYNINGDSAYSNEANATTFTVTIPPAAPSNLTASAISSDQIDLSWIDNSDNEVGFYIERKTGAGGTYTQVANVGANVYTYSDTSLTNNTTYYYRLKAYNIGGESSFSNEASAITYILNPPVGLTATSVSYSQIDLSWTDNSDNENGFYIERKTGSGGVYAQISNVGANITIYSDTELNPDTTYYYRVKAYNIDGESPYSNEINITTPSIWQINIVDSNEEWYGISSIALDSFNNPHISYCTKGMNLSIKYAKWTGTSWDIMTVASGGEYNSLALDSAGNPHISYYDDRNHHRNLKYAKWNGTSWDIQVVDSNAYVGLYNSLALDSNGNPHISYYDLNNGELQYAHWNGSSWSIEVVYWAGGYTSIAIDSSDNPHISYGFETISQGHLNYAYYNGATWEIQTVDNSSNNVGIFNSIAIDSNNNAHISYRHWGEGQLKYAYQNSGSWEIQTVDDSSQASIKETSIALDSNDNPHISYFANSNLKYARWNGVSWRIQTVTIAEYINPSNSLALDSYDEPHISYYDGNGTNGDMKYATSDVTPSGTPGDCNGDGLVDAGDISALVLEIFDGDGNLPADTPGGTFPGDPVGSDSNEDGIVDAGDVSCTVLMIFNGPGACGGGAASASSALSAASAILDSHQVGATGPGLDIPDMIAPNPDGTVTVPVNFTSNGNDVSATVFSIDYDESLLSFDPADKDQDGIPDSVTFDINPITYSRGITFNAGDNDGELDLLISDNAAPLVALPDSTLVEITFTVLLNPPSQTVASVNFSESVFVSYGDTSGQSVDGTTDNGSVLIPAGETCSHYTTKSACKAVKYCTWNKRKHICERK